MQSTIRTGARVSGPLAALALATLAAATEPAPPADSLLDLPLAELLQIPVQTATRRHQALQNVPATMLVLTAQDIRDRGYESLEDAVRDLPGVDLVDVQGTFPLIWAPRGAYGDENKRTLLLIDGIVENNILEGNVLGGPQYSLHNIERIEVLWGPASALYGANAFSAVINLITKKGRDLGGMTVQLGTGRDDTRFEKFLVGDRRGDVEYVLSGSRYQTDGPVFSDRHPDYALSYVDDAYSFSGQLRLGNYSAGFHRYDRPMGHGQFANPANAWFGLPLFGYNNSEGQAVNNSISPVPLNGQPGSLWHSLTSTAYVKGTQHISDQLKFDEMINYRETEIVDDSYVYTMIGAPANPQWAFLPFTHFSKLFGGEWLLDYGIDDQQHLIAGVSYERRDVEHGYRQWYIAQDTPRIWGIVGERVSDIYRNAAAFAQYQLDTSLLQATTFTFGLRYDDNSVYGNTTNPRLGMVSKPFDNWTFKALYGSAYRAPNSFDSFSVTTTRIANPDLSPELTRNLEFSAGWQASATLHTEATLFRNRLDDIIVSNVPIGDIDGDGDIETQNRNAGNADIDGIELRLQYRPSAQFAAFANASYQDAEQTQLGNAFPVPNVAAIKANLGMTWHWQWNHSLYTIGRYVGPRETAPTNPRNEVGDYFVVDVALATRPFADERIGITLRINNLLDTEYADPGVRVADGLSFATQHDYPGRHGWLKLAFEF